MLGKRKAFYYPFSHQIEIATEKSTFRAGSGGVSKVLTSDTKFKRVPKHSVIKMNDVFMQYFIKSTFILKKSIMNKTPTF